MDVFQIALIVAALLCSLVAGFVFAFTVVIMPGITSLNDQDFIRTFQVVDRVIQDRQPVFMIVWVGSVLALVTAAAMGFGQSDGVERVLILVAVVVYLLGVQLPTATINVPLNNQLQALDVDSWNGEVGHAARAAFEARWNRWNTIRTVFACLVSIILLAVLLKL